MLLLITGPAIYFAALFADEAGALQPMVEWRTAPEAQVLLHPFTYDPQVIRLEAGRPVKLSFINNGQATLSFSAPDFFRTARIRGSDAPLVENGRLRLAPGERRIVAVVPAPGRYRVHSANLTHRILGMTATIIVE